MKRSKRLRRRIRRGIFRPMVAHRTKNNRLKVRKAWMRKHPTISSFSYGRKIKKGRRRL